MPIIDQSQPFTADVGAEGTETPLTPTSAVSFSGRHDMFVKIINTFKKCFKKSEVYGFDEDELNEHLLVAIQDNAIVQDGDRFCTSQTAWRLRELTKGYVYERL